MGHPWSMGGLRGVPSPLNKMGCYTRRNHHGCWVIKDQHSPTFQTKGLLDRCGSHMAYCALHLGEEGHNEALRASQGLQQAWLSPAWVTTGGPCLVIGCLQRLISGTIRSHSSGHSHDKALGEGTYRLTCKQFGDRNQAIFLSVQLRVKAQ
jgi:hypothetical protein